MNGGNPTLPLWILAFARMTDGWWDIMAIIPPSWQSWFNNQKHPLVPLRSTKGDACLTGEELDEDVSDYSDYDDADAACDPTREAIL